MIIPKDQREKTRNLETWKHGHIRSKMNITEKGKSKKKVKEKPYFFFKKKELRYLGRAGLPQTLTNLRQGSFSS